MRPSAFLASLVLGLLPVAACANSDDDGDSGEAALATCTLPDAGPLKAAASWVPPGGFVNVESSADGVDVRVEKMAGATGTGSTRKFGLTGSKPSWVVSFDNGAKGFFRVVASRQGKDLGEVRVRVSQAIPQLRLGVKGSDGKIDPVVSASGAKATVTGTIVDELGSPAIVSINGVKQNVSGGQFSISLPSDPGVHLVDAQVIDVACNSYPVTGSYVAATSRGGDAHLRVRASQSAVDKIGSLVEAHFGEVVKVGPQSQPVANALGQSLFLDGVDFPSDPGAIHLKLTLQNGGLGLHLSVDGELIGHARLNSTPTTVRITNFSLDGTVTVGQSGQFGLRVGNVGGDVSADLASFPVPLLGLFQPFLHQAIAMSVSQIAPGLLQNAFAGQKGDIPVPLPWASAKPATIHYGLGPIAVNGSAFSADIHTSVANAPQFAKLIDTPAPASGGELGLGISYGTVNQVLYALWSKGDFTPTLGADDIAKLTTGQPLPAFLKDSQIDVAVDNPAIPPVVLPSSDGKLVHVGVGSLPIHVFAQGSGLSTKLDGEVDVTGDFNVTGDGNSVSVTVVKADPHARIVGRIDVNASLDDVTALMKDLSVKLAGLLAMNTVTMPIPAFDLSATNIPALKGTQVTVGNIGLGITSTGVAANGTATFNPPR